MIKKILMVLDRHQRSRVYLLLLMILGGAFLETFGVSAILPLVSAVTDPSIIETNKYFSTAANFLNIHDSKLFILVMAIALIVVYAIKNVYLIVLNVAQNHFYTNNLRRMSVRLMNCYLHQGYLFHADHNVAELERNANRDVSSFMYVLNNVLMLITESLVCIFLTAFLLLTDVFTTSLMITMLGAFLLFFALVVRKRLKYYGNCSREKDADKNKYFLEAFGGIKEIKASSTEKHFLKKYEDAYKGFAYMEQKKLTLTYIPRPLMESICICGLLLFMAIRIIMGSDVNEFIPIMSVFAVAAIRMLPSFNRVSGYLGSIMFYKTSVDALYNDLVEAERLEKEAPVSEEELISVPSADIIAEHIDFAYPARPDKKILDDVSIRVPCNKSVAFIGPSGAGKTTLADLILGVLDPQSGSVTVGNVDVIKCRRSWHRNIGYIPQSTFLMDDTIRANVAFGLDSKDIDDEKVWEALRAAQLADFVKEQPDGIYSSIGDKGVKISGGQRQRIGIARALYNNPSVVVLDEATSALDNDTEKAVMDAIYQLAGRKTMIIIAHRLTTIRNCDVIYEIKDGKATEVTYDQINQE
ncbi:ABC transporter ATP-binding protein [Butyrivibrio sp. FCS006]|uniref:ABC transporter ATP-binding protein n=1 Tax=Butyrivibrio sp. FCS006 TaxID=1280684 RepID=UPI000414700A|nr:ABC transporter ATP-binding protein [Butyrivibrio sp. FCS006]